MKFQPSQLQLAIAILGYRRAHFVPVFVRSANNCTVQEHTARPKFDINGSIKLYEQRS